MSIKIEIEIDELLFEMINKALKKRNQNIGSDISINHYVKLLAEKSFKQLLVEHYDDIFKELTNDIDAIDRNLEGKKFNDLFTIDELIKESRAKDKAREIE